MRICLGITMRVVNEASYSEERDALSRDWHNYLHKIIPGLVLIPLLNNPKLAVRLVKNIKLNGVILSNGNSWGEDLRRDNTEKIIVEHCCRNNLPILGVCRGMQVLNVLFNGRLQKDIKNKSKEEHVGVKHRIFIKKLPFRYGSKKEGLIVNSFHNQGIMVDDVANKFNILAATDSGVVEGIFHKTRPFIGIQWHPERDNPAKNFDRYLIRKIFV